MPYLNIDLDYFDHPKTVRLIGLLGRDADILPIRLWKYCGKFMAEDGRLVGLSVQEIEAAMGWRGQTGKAVDALTKLGFLEPDESEGFKVHGWQEHQGHLYAYKIRGQIAAQARWSKLQTECNKHASSNAKASAKQCPSSSAPTDPTALILEPDGSTQAKEDVAQMIADEWNSSGVLPKCRILTISRRKKIAERLKDPQWRMFWKEAIGRAVGSSFLQGKSPRGWKADFDWFLQAESLQRIIEGRYDDKERGATDADHQGEF